MKLKKLTFSMEELTWAFADLTDNGGKIVLMWDKEMVTVPFKVGPGWAIGNLMERGKRTAVV